MIDPWDEPPFPRYGRCMLEVGNDGLFYVSEFPFEVEIESGVFETIRPGTGTDLFSIPWPLRVFYRTWGKGTKAAVLHDYQLTYGTVPRWKADKIFRDGMYVLGERSTKATAFYGAVRGYGWVKEKVFSWFS